MPSDDAAVRAALPGATLVWIETPSNPGMARLDVAALAEAAHAAGALLAVDGTVATPLRERALELGADFAMASASKYLTGHADLVLGYVATRDPARAQAIRAWRGLTGAIPGPFEVWLAHRSLPTHGAAAGAPGGDRPRAGRAAGGASGGDRRSLAGHRRGARLHAAPTRTRPSGCWGP